MMIEPLFVFGFLLATLTGAGFHLVFGGDARRLALDLIVGWAGFGIGHIIGVLTQFNVFNIGSLHAVSAVIGSLAALAAANTLAGGSRHGRSSI